MKAVCKLIVILFAMSLQTSSVYSYQDNAHKVGVMKALKKAWQSNWVKAGTLATSSGLAYALYSTHQNNQKLFWALMTTISALSTCACAYLGYESLNAAQKDISSNDSPDMELDDSFFDFPVDETLSGAQLSDALLNTKPTTHKPSEEPVVSTASVQQVSNPVNKEIIAQPEETENTLTQISQTSDMVTQELPSAPIVNSFLSEETAA